MLPGKKKKQKKGIKVFDILLFFIAIALIVQFAPKFYSDKKNELVSMSATSEMRQNIRNAMNFAIKVPDADLGDSKSAFIEASGLKGLPEPWWMKCVNVELIMGKDAYISVSKIDPEKELKEKCDSLYAEPQMKRWLSGNLYISNEALEQMENNATN